jgi:hypothetical protein
MPNEEFGACTRVQGRALFITQGRAIDGDGDVRVLGEGATFQ